MFLAPFRPPLLDVKPSRGLRRARRERSVFRPKGPRAPTVPVYAFCWDSLVRPCAVLLGAAALCTSPRRTFDLFGGLLSHFAREASRGGAFPSSECGSRKAARGISRGGAGTRGANARSRHRSAAAGGREPRRRAVPARLIRTGWRFAAIWIAPAFASFECRGFRRMRARTPAPLPLRSLLKNRRATEADRPSLRGLIASVAAFWEFPWRLGVFKSA